MKKITLNEIANSCNGEFIGDVSLKDTTVSSIAIDSRKVIKGTLFIAIKGERVDGHNYINQTFENGAICAVSEKRIDNISANTPYILVKSTLQAIKDIATYYRTKFNIPFIGISGSVGKTSTKEMIYSVLSQKYAVHKTQGNFNNEIGVPLTIFDMDKDAQVAVIEMGISGFGEMTNLSKIVKPDYCVLTNIGDCHLENLKDKDGVLKAKTEMFEYMQNRGKVFLYGDDEKLRSIKEVKENSPIFYGISDNNEYFATEIENSGLDGIDCILNSEKEQIKVHIPSIGNYMINNALCAYAIGKEFKLEKEEIASGIANYKTVGSRANIIKANNYTIIDDCYNANPVSVKSAIDTLVNFENRKVAIIGDMKELGENEVKLHQEVGMYIESKKVDVLIAIGPLAKELISKINMNKAYWYKDINEAKTEIKLLLQPHDVILVKGSRSMKLEQIVEYIAQ